MTPFWWLSLLPFALQAAAIAFDEGYFHLKRGLPKWERIGHPLDTLTVLLCMGYLIWVPFSKTALFFYIALASFSSLFVTKDEFVHKEHCPASEQWLHAILFTLHPITLAMGGLIWPVIQGVDLPSWITEWLSNREALSLFLKVQFSAMALFFLYQVIYWNFVWVAPEGLTSLPLSAPASSNFDQLDCFNAASLTQPPGAGFAKGKDFHPSGSINNDFYEELAGGWYEASDHPIALLRAENRVRIPWILSTLPSPARFLDIGCGGGFLTNALASAGHSATGLDLSPSSLKIAREKDTTRSVHYVEGSAYELPFPDESFDAVAAMDLLEHVEEPNRVIAEASRVLKPNGLFFFHTFNRNLLSYLLIIKGVDWLVPNAPKNMHVYPLFIKPKELEAFCNEVNLEVTEWRGFRPKFSPFPFLKMALQKKVPSDLTFSFSKSLATGYCGVAQKKR